MNMTATGNAFAQALREGRFSIILECATAAESSRAARGRDEALAKKVGEQAAVAGVSVADRTPAEDAADPASRAALFAKHSGKPVVMHLSGKGSDPNRIQDLLSRARAVGLNNLFAVTGDRSVYHETARATRRVAPYEAGYLDSVRSLHMARERADADFCLGAAVNPHKYHVADLYAQLFKAVRKVSCGAEYLVAQAGWDMRKFHELQWFLQMRELDVPVLARVLLLSTSEIQDLPDSLPPGAAMSRSLAAQFQRECSVNETQSLAAQMQRIALQTAGLRLMGYNGVQIGGVHDPQTLEMVVKRIHEGLETHTDFAAWLAAWNEFHDGVHFPPVPRPFYLFQDADDVPALYDPETTVLSDTELPPPVRRERVRARILSMLLAPAVPKWLRDPFTRLLCPSCREHLDLLNEAEYLCISHCPKRLVYGPCGSGRPDGTCEFGKGPCFFHRVLGLACARRRVDLLETDIADD